MKALVIAACLVLFPQVSFSAKAAAPTTGHLDVETPFYIGTLLRLPGSGFSLVPTSGGLNFGNSLHYRPATQLLFGISARYKIIGGEFILSLPLLAAFQASEGRSTYQDWRINYYGNEWGVEFNYSDYTGYLIENVPGSAGEPHTLLPNLKNIGAGAVVYYVLSPESYSLGAAFDQRVRQKWPGGSFFLVGSVRYQEIRSDVAVIPTSRQGNFGTDGTLTRAAMKSLAGGAGYGFNFVLMDFFLSLATTVEVGPQLINYSLSSGDVSQLFLGVNARARVGAGFNGETILTGVNVYADGYTEGTRSIVLVNVNYGAQLFFGFRF